MGNPTNTTDYPAFAGATGKQDLLRDLQDKYLTAASLQTVIFRIANTDLNALTDKSTIYIPDDNWAGT